MHSNNTIRDEVPFMRIGTVSLILGSMFLGCERGRPSLQTVVPVELIVAVQGKPPVGARVVLHPTLGDPAGSVPARPRGTVSANGVVSLTTFHTDDGAPEGDYIVTIVWPATPMTDSRGETSPGPDQFAARYADPSRSPLKLSVRKDSQPIRLTLSR